MGLLEVYCLVLSIKKSTLVLMELLQKAGLSAYVGKVNMDRNSPDFLIEETNQSLVDTKEWLRKICSIWSFSKTYNYPSVCTILYK